MDAVGHASTQYHSVLNHCFLCSKRAFGPLFHPYKYLAIGFHFKTKLMMGLKNIPMANHKVLPVVFFVLIGLLGICSAKRSLLTLEAYISANGYGSGHVAGVGSGVGVDVSGGYSGGGGSGGGGGFVYASKGEDGEVAHGSGGGAGGGEGGSAGYGGAAGHGGGGGGGSGGGAGY